jgi:hypothetical protein
MRAEILFLFLAFSLCVFSQERITGQIFDKETQEPILGVVVYTNSGNNITMTDNKGQYTLDVHPSEPIYFRQLAYDFLTIISDTLRNNPNVYLVRNTIELSEVVVSPFHAENLLNKAFRNLVLNLQKKEVNSYLFHIDEITSIGGEREAFALVEINRSKPNWKKRIYWNFNLSQIDRIKIVNDSSFYIGKKPVWADLFPQEFSVRSILNNYICELYENKEEQLVIKAYPKHLDKKNYRYALYTINKQDTVLIEYLAQSYSEAPELTLNKINKDTEWQITNQFFDMKFSQEETSGLYYVKEVKHLGSSRIISDINSSYNELFKSTAVIVGRNTINTKKKILPRDYVLFESDLPNSPDFWKKYINQ